MPDSKNTVFSTKEQSAHLLMCAPEHFVVTYKINPWMKPDEWQNNSAALKYKAKQSWESLYRAFLSMGINVDFSKSTTHPSRYGLYGQFGRCP